MTTETVLARMLPGVEATLKAVVERALGAAAAPTLYDLEALTQGAMPRLGQIILQELTRAQGSGLGGPTRACGCGQQQVYHDQARPVGVQTSVGEIRLEQRAYYRCAGCGATSYPLDEQLGLGPAGRMSRYLQEQCGWLLALLPGRVGVQTLVRFGWPAVSASQLREKADALGAALDAQGQRRLAVLRAAALLPASHVAPRQPARGSRLYAAPDGLMYCTTQRDPQTGKLVWRELKAAAVYEAAPRDQPAAPPAGTIRPPLRERLRTWLGAQPGRAPQAPVDHAVRISYVAQTGPYAQFGACLWAELRERGLGCPVRDLAVVADGSPHLDQIVDNELRLPGIHLTRVLDLPHAQGRLWAVSGAIFGEGAALGRRWVQAPLPALERGQVDQVCATLEDLALTVEGADPEGARRARQAAAYFDRRTEQLAYPDFLAAGYQLGSGLAESACKRFGTDRMKGAGMRWTVPGAQQVATLRMLLLSDRWQEVTDHCRAAA